MIGEFETGTPGGPRKPLISGNTEKIVWVHGNDQHHPQLITALLTLPGHWQPIWLTGYFNVDAPSVVAFLTPFNGGNAGPNAKGVTIMPDNNPGTEPRSVQFGPTVFDPRAGEAGVTWTTLVGDAWHYAWVQVFTSYHATITTNSGKRMQIPRQTNVLDGHFAQNYDEDSGDSPAANYIDVGESGWPGWKQRIG